MKIYKRIRELRNQSGKTQGQVADDLKMQREVYRRYETGERDIPLSVAIAIADLFHVSLDYITDRSDDKTVQRKESKSD